MRRRVARILVAGATFAATTAVVEAPASSAPATWTITPGGPYTAATSGNTVLTDIDTGTQLTCTPDNSTTPPTPASTASGTLKSGSGNSNPLGTIDNVTFGNPPDHPCSGPLGITFTVEQIGTWEINGESQSSGVTQGYIGNIEARITGPGCSATVQGPNGTKGEADGTYTNSTGVLDLQPDATPRQGHELTITNVQGCSGLINNGDTATFEGAYNVDPVQTITSP